MITLKKKHPAKVPYMLHTKMGDYVASDMDATIAEELLQRSKKVYRGEDKGYELVTDDEMMFPIACFDFEEGDVRPMPRRKPAKRLDDDGAAPAVQDAKPEAKAKGAAPKGKGEADGGEQ